MMKKTLLLLSLFALGFAAAAAAGEDPQVMNQTREHKTAASGLAVFDIATVAPAGVSMPVGRIILARKGPEYCAVRFRNTWVGNERFDYHASYEYFHQGDGSGDFKRRNVKSGDGELFYPREVDWLEIPFTSKIKDSFSCGGMKIRWFYTGGVSFGDLELAPTPWMRITDVDAHDARLKWFRKDSVRTKTMVPLGRF
jgi:hypothetical protein